MESFLQGDIHHWNEAVYARLDPDGYSRQRQMSRLENEQGYSYSYSSFTDADFHRATHQCPNCRFGFTKFRRPR